MIGRLKGLLWEKHPPSLLLDVQGVGYELEAPMTTFYVLPECGSEVILFTHQVIRDDAVRLYGFAQLQERDLFRVLLRINGVGAKLGLAILSGMDAAALARCVYESDTSSLMRVPGVGKKTAQRLIMEMRDRVDSYPAGSPLPSGGEFGAQPVAEAVSALVALGLSAPEASRQVRAIDCQDLACEEIVRRALQSLAR